MGREFIPDESQLKVIRAQAGFHLVLAPPGCGKTHILTERIVASEKKGISPDDMLCLTFTNRAAREMQNRLQTVDVIPAFVGNVHRFCARYLFEEQKIEAAASIIDDDEAVSILADFTNEDEEHVLSSSYRLRDYHRIIFLSHLLEQREHGHERRLFLHPEVEEDLQKESNVYYARQYAAYKESNHLLDFEDLLIRTYDACRQGMPYRQFQWIQIDEVQDLNALQLAIVDQLTAKDATVVYLGDEQQAIFSFMGAKLEALDFLKERCKGHVYHLSNNHRSPSYLLNVFNDYAEKQLHVDRQLLPVAMRQVSASAGDMRVLYSATMDSEVRDVVQLVDNLYNQHPDETTAVIVSANADADLVSEEMTARKLPHFKVSGRDLFDTKDVKLLLSHLTVLSNEHHFISWTRLLKGLKVFPNSSLARRFVRKLRQLAISPADFLLYDHSTYVLNFLEAYRAGEMVVFDTETTGVDVFNDDIIEISAMRVKHGDIIGEPLDLYIRTTREIPPMLGDKPNPMCLLYREKERAGELLEPSEALQRFNNFCGNLPVVGHNVSFDEQIIRHYERRTVGSKRCLTENVVFDTLKLMRLLEPHLTSYRLETLIEQFGLMGENSHRAIDDVGATVSLLQLCHQKSKFIEEQQRNFIAHQKVCMFANRLRANYQELYVASVSRLYQEQKGGEPALVGELRITYDYMKANGYVEDIPRFVYITRYLAGELITDAAEHPALIEQLRSYIMDINTMKEADFCNSSVMEEKVYVTTVHKAKGLEFDNVIVFDAVDGRYPNYYNKHPRQDAEDARKFYVAISRAKKRLVVAYSMQTTDRYGGIHSRNLTPFMNSIMHFFS